MKSFKMTRSRAIIFAGILVASLVLVIQAKASSANTPSVTVVQDTSLVQSNTVNAPDSGNSNPSGHLPPGHNH
jgi:hypothetical protein